MMESYTIKVSKPVYQLLNQQASNRNSSLDNILERLLIIAPFVLPESNQLTVEEDLQLELIKLYASQLEYKELLGIKKFLAKFSVRKTIQGVDKIWDEQNLSDQTMELWLNEG